MADKERIYPKDIILDKQGPCYGDYKAISLEEAVAIFERKYILDALNGARSIREAARNLSTTHTLLLNRMKKYSIKKDGQVYK